MSTTTISPAIYSKQQIRIAVSVFFFCQGICFASWASRIPDIKTSLHLSEAALGSILLALPVGQILTMFFSGRAVTRFGSKTVLRIAAACYAVALTNIGLATKPWHLALCLFFFGVCGNMCNISVNTQGINAENLYGRTIMSSFHGVWSVSGFTGALIGALMMQLQLTPYIHFWIIAAFVIVAELFAAKYLLYTATSKAAGSIRNIQKPEKLLIKLGIIGFCCLSCEGCMFDWSGVYFKDVVKAQGYYVSLGYAAFMITMAIGRFAGDKLAEKFSRKKMVQVSGVLIFCGMMLAVLLPQIITATIGFLLVGFGVSSIVPLLYSTAGKASKAPSGIAIATVSSIAFLGFVMGPPFIGYIAELAGLQYSFMTIAFLGLGISYMVSKVKEIE
ncbi:MFS transporter [Ferruginibacter sp.]|nr:MFS transporter [Ferruginibacter sp.]